MKTDRRLYGSKDDEEFTATTLDEYVGRYLEECDPSSRPESLTVHEYAPRSDLPEPSTLAEVLLEVVYENLDDEFGGPCGEGYVRVPSVNVKAAAYEFASLVLEEYVPWQCEATGVVHLVNVDEWLKRHNQKTGE